MENICTQAHLIEDACALAICRKLREVYLEALVHGLPRPQGGGESGRPSFLPASIEASDIRLHLLCMSALPSLRTFNGLLEPPEDHPNVLHRQGRLPRPC
jgi:hypothetical protein